MNNTPPPLQTCWASLLSSVIPFLIKFFFSFILQFVEILSEHFRRDFGKFLDFFLLLLDFREHYDNIVFGQHLPTPF
jgi:hypothetical protein